MVQAYLTPLLNQFSSGYHYPLTMKVSSTMIGTFKIGILSFATDFDINKMGFATLTANGPKPPYSISSQHISVTYEESGSL